MVTLATSACGEQRPEEVAETLSKAAYECGEEGAGVIYDQTLPSTREITREQAIGQERQQGCEPKERPATTILLICEQQDRAVIQERAADGNSSADVYVKTDDGWLLDPDTDTTDVCGPAAPS